MERKEVILIRELAEKYCNENNLYVVKVEQASNKITIYADGDENITIQQCGRLSRFVQHELEENNPEILVDFSFDVSSPGMSNSLLLPFQFKKRIGKNLELILEDGVEILADILEVDNEKITYEITIPKNKKLKIEEKKEQYTINYSQIKKATIPLPLNFKKK